MNISVKYTPDLRQTFRLNLWMHRKSIWVTVAFGVILIAWGAILMSGPSLELGLFLVCTGALLVIEPPIVVFMGVYRLRQIILKQAEITLTSEGIEWRTATTTLKVTWDMVERIYELKDVWIFFVNKLTRIGLFKQNLAGSDEAELTAFIAAWPMVAREKVHGGTIHHLRIE